MIDAGSPRPNCLVCGNADADEFFRLDGVPTQDGRLWATRDEAMTSPRGDIRYAFCDRCGLVWNRAFDPSLLRFDAGYDINLAHSPQYRAFVDDECRRLVETYGLRGRGKRVLEIGCGKGTFLQALCEAGDVTGIGFDPTFVQGSLDDERVTITSGYFDADADAAAAVGPVDLVVCRGVMQYFATPGDLVRQARSLLRPGGAAYFEVPNGLHTFRRPCVWNAVYEHASWYTPPSLARVFADAGFAPTRVVGCFTEEQNLTIDARPADGPVALDDAAEVRRIGEDVARFADAYAEKVGRWRDVLLRLDGEGKSVGVWGCGARGITLLTQCDPDGRRVGRCVDINPRRQSMFMPLTGHEVRPPDELAGGGPDHVVITNASFAGEIKADLSRLGVTCETSIL